jgi:hypothetical protein
MPEQQPDCKAQRAASQYACEQQAEWPIGDGVGIHDHGRKLAVPGMSGMSLDERGNEAGDAGEAADQGVLVHARSVARLPPRTL